MVVDPMNTVLIRTGDRGADYVKLTPEIQVALFGTDVRFVARYAVPPETTKIGKAITDDEIAWLHANRIAVVLVWEINVSDGYFGAPAGTRAGTWLKAYAEAHQIPREVPMFCAVDTDTTVANVQVFTRYVRAFAAAVAPYRLGLYGDTDIAAAVADLDPVVWRPAARAWGINSDVVVHVQQHIARPPGIDPNTCLAPFTAWLPTLEEDPDMTNDRAFAKVDAADTALLLVDSVTARWVRDWDEIAMLKPIVANTVENPLILTPGECKARMWLGQQPHYSQSSTAGAVRCHADMFGGVR